jgi:hypothetical protein
MKPRTLSPAVILLGIVMCIGPARAVNVAPEGTGIIGVNDDLDYSDLGTERLHAGSILAINDEVLTSRIDTWFGDGGGDGGQTFSYVGILWDALRTDAVRSLTLTMATFFDGGWFGQSSVGVGAGNPLTAAVLIEPEIQVTNDGGSTWTTLGHTSNYLTSFTGHRVGGGGQPNPSSRSATFTLNAIQANIDGIRVIGSNGGSAGADANGFIGVFELAVDAVPASDVDADGMDDAWETAHGLNVGTNDAAADPDADGLPNGQEFVRDTNPQDADSDDDGLNDGPEVATHMTDPKLSDSDGDGLADGAEVTVHMTNPAVSDTDGDQLNDGDEILLHTTNPTLSDTDGDGFGDGLEVAQSTNPRNPADHPPNIALVGTAILGTNDAIDTDEGTPFSHAGGTTNINDGNLTTSVDTFGPAEPMSFVGILWSAPRAEPVARLELTLATFFDGGWFGTSGLGPGAGGVLTSLEHLIPPEVQVTADGGVTWSAANYTSDYLTALEGHALPAIAFGTPTPGLAIFNLDPPVAGIDGIRLIGSEGGTASGGFLGVFELAVLSASTPVDTDADGQSDPSEAIAGTNPNDPRDNLRITGVQRSGNQVMLTWTSVPGKSYRVQDSTALVSWTTAPAAIPASAAPATTTQTTINRPAPTPPSLNFRIIVAP